MPAADAPDGEAIAALYRRWAPQLRQLAAGILNSVDDAEDVVQETFYAMCLAARNGRGPNRSAAGYLYTVARHAAHRQLTRNEQLVGIGVPIEPSNDPQAAQLEDPTAAAFAGLPRRWRAVLWLIEVEGYSPAELAPAMAMTPNAVSSLATRARRALRTAYRQQGRG
ncbi:RNA polymerase sigma factor [Jiangella anatolica]|uniref:RNA polymerase sigma factor n=1 Tax=Jiangella anatolica TaxID=2670374 RepID=UPI00131475E1|nr:sigma-70 family RNA polymerase sigma factor [Jiangella anatolica]